MTQSHWWRRGWMVASLALIVVSAAVFGYVQAQQVDRYDLSVSPQIIEIDANPGETNKNTVRVTNNGEETVKLLSGAQNIIPEGEEGAYVPTEDQTTYALAQWVTVTPAEIDLLPAQTQDFDVTIDFPVDAEPGGHFATVIFQTVPPDLGEGAGAQVVGELALPVMLARVSGDITESAELVDFASTKNFWSNQRPITFETRIRNTGNVHYRPSGSITVKNTFGKQVAKLNITEENALPGYVRRLVTEWKDPGFAVGRYTADLVLVYGADNQTITASTSFIVFPYQTIIPALLLIAVALFVLIRFRKRIWLAIKVLSGRS